MSDDGYHQEPHNQRVDASRSNPMLMLDIMSYTFYGIQHKRMHLKQHQHKAQQTTGIKKVGSLFYLLDKLSSRSMALTLRALPVWQTSLHSSPLPIDIVFSITIPAKTSDKPYILHH